MHRLYCCFILSPHTLCTHGFRYEEEVKALQAKLTAQTEAATKAENEKKELIAKLEKDKQVRKKLQEYSKTLLEEVSDIIPFRVVFLYACTRTEG